MRKIVLLSLISLLILNSCSKDSSSDDSNLDCSIIDLENINSDCSCVNLNINIIDNIDGIDSYTDSEITYNYPAEGETLLHSMGNYYMKKATPSDEITSIGINLIKYVFNFDKYDIIYIPVDGDGLSPYSFSIEYNDTNNEKKVMSLIIDSKLSLTLSAPGCIKSNNHLYRDPMIYAKSMDEDTINDIKKFIELIKEYLEDKEAELIKPFD